MEGAENFFIKEPEVQKPKETSYFDEYITD